jgi:hypothetical protein
MLSVVFCFLDVGLILINKYSAGAAQAFNEAYLTVKISRNAKFEGVVLSRTLFSIFIVLVVTSLAVTICYYGV